MSNEQSKHRRVVEPNNVHPGHHMMLNLFDVQTSQSTYVVMSFDSFKMNRHDKVIRIMIIAHYNQHRSLKTQ